MSIFSRQTKSQKLVSNAQTYGTMVLATWAVNLGVQVLNGFFNSAGKNIAAGAANIKAKRDSANVAKEAQADAATEASAPAQEAPATPAG
tara:strand:- start:638 stop:907 length:270 start_codon:yes stop_codon:yes gene_type:complete